MRLVRPPGGAHGSTYPSEKLAFVILKKSPCKSWISNCSIFSTLATPLELLHILALYKTPRKPVADPGGQSGHDPQSGHGPKIVRQSGYKLWV